MLAAEIQIKSCEHVRILWHDGCEENAQLEDGDQLYVNMRADLDYLRGASERPPNRLVDTRPFVEFYDLALIAAEHITAVDDACIVRSEPEHGIEAIAVWELAVVQDEFPRSERFPSEQRAPWGVGPRGITDRRYRAA